MTMSQDLYTVDVLTFRGQPYVSLSDLLAVLWKAAAQTTIAEKKAVYQEIAASLERFRENP